MARRGWDKFTVTHSQELTQEGPCPDLPQVSAGGASQVQYLSPCSARGVLHLCNGTDCLVLAEGTPDILHSAFLLRLALAFLVPLNYIRQGRRFVPGVHVRAGDRHAQGIQPGAVYFPSLPHTGHSLGKGCERGIGTRCPDALPEWLV